MQTPFTHMVDEIWPDGHVTETCTALAASDGTRLLRIRLTCSHTSHTTKSSHAAYTADHRTAPAVDTGLAWHTADSVHALHCWHGTGWAHI